jgi:hypothetical protein
MRTAAAVALWISATSFAHAASTLTVLPTNSSGWQNYSYTFSSNATVDVFLGVADAPGDGSVSTLDLDNIYSSLPSNLLTDFSSGSLPSGFQAQGNSAIRTEPFGHGNFARLYSDGNVNTSSVGGTDKGSVLGFSFSALAGQTFSFDWRFTAGSGKDFAFLNLNIDNGAGSPPVIVQSTLASTDTAPVPVPAAAWLLGSALASMGVFRRRTR